MPLRLVCAGDVEEVQAACDLLGDLLTAIQAHPGRGQLDAQRQASDQATDANHVGQVLRCEMEVRGDAPRAQDEKLDGTEVFCLGDVRIRFGREFRARPTA